MILSAFYLIGMFLLFCATNPNIFHFSNVIAPVLFATPENATVVMSGVKFLPSPASLLETTMPYWAIILALGLIAFGTGGIKPCVSAHGGDQFLKEQTFGLNQFYSFFYIAINVGAVLSGFISPKIKELNCFGTESDCYSYSFLVSTVVFGIAYILFAFGKRFYRVVPPAGRFVIWDLLKASAYKLFYGKEKAVKKFGASLLIEATDLGKVLFAISPTPLFWLGLIHWLI